MKPSLQLKLSQHLALTPQLQQSIRLLQLSTLELNQELEQILSENPLLERLDDPLQSCVAIAPNGGLDGMAQASMQAGSDARESGPDAAAPDSQAGGADERSDAAADAWDDAGGDSAQDWRGESAPRSSSDDGEDERDWPQLAGGEISLREHLASQLAGTHASPRDRALVTMLIDELSDDGMLETGLDEIAGSLPEELDVTPEELSAAMRLLQSFDPAGIGARDLRECLLLQLDAGGLEDRPEPQRRAAREIVASHLDALAARDYPRIKRALRCDDDTLREAQALIEAARTRAPGRTSRARRRPTWCPT